jgi:site-specific DNA recombinase
LIKERQVAKSESHRRPIASCGPAAKLVGIWIRVSTEDQAKGESPEHHERRARMYAEAKGWEVVTVYHLEGVSGKAVMAHPEAGRMMDDVKAGRVTGLIFSKLARLARNTKELLEFAEFFRAQAADLISLHESIDTSTPAGRFFYTMIAAMAAWEREEIAERVAVSVPIRAKLGKPLGGAAPFGYEWKDRQLVIQPEEAAVRRLIYDLFLEHKRFLTVANILNERGYRMRGGFLFSRPTVARLIRDPVAKGIRRANYTMSGDRAKSWVLKPEEEWIHVPAPPIVSEELWEAANAIAATRHKKPTRTPRKAVQLFAGFTLCHCGTKMYVPSNTPKYVCMKRGCRNKVPQVDLERVFQEQLKRFLFSPEEVAAALEEADENLGTKVELLEALRKEDTRLTTEADQIYRLYLAGDLSGRGFGERNRPLEERRRQLEEEIPRLQGEIDFLKIQQLSQASVLTEAQDLYTRWFDLSFEERRNIVETIVERITVGKEEIEITLSYDPSPPPPPPPLKMVSRDAHGHGAGRR